MPPFRQAGEQVALLELEATTPAEGKASTVLDAFQTHIAQLPCQVAGSATCIHKTEWLNARKLSPCAGRVHDGPWKLEVHKQYVVPLVEFSTQVPPFAQAGEQVVLLPLEATTPARLRCLNNPHPKTETALKCSGDPRCHRLWFRGCSIRIPGPLKALRGLQLIAASYVTRPACCANEPGSWALTSSWQILPWAGREQVGPWYADGHRQ